MALMSAIEFFGYLILFLLLSPFLAVIFILIVMVVGVLGAIVWGALAFLIDRR